MSPCPHVAVSPCPRVPVSPGLPALRGSRLVFCPCPARRWRGSAGACSHALFMGRTAARATQPPQELLLHPWVLPPGTVQLPPAPPGAAAAPRGVHTGGERLHAALFAHEGIALARGVQRGVHKGCALAQGLFAPRCMCKGQICTIVCVCVCVCAQARGVSTGSLRLCAAELRSRKRFGHAPGACTPGTGPCTGGTRLHAPAVPGAAGTPPYSAPGSESAPSPAGTAAAGHGSGDQQRTRGGGTLEDTAGAGHLGPGFSIFPNFPKSPPRKPYEGLFYPTGAHIRLCFPHLSPSPCPNPAPGGSAPLLPHHRGVFGAGGRVPSAPPRLLQPCELAAGARDS